MRWWRGREACHICPAKTSGSPGDSLAEVIEALRHGLASKPEVVVIHNFAWHLLPEDTRQNIAGLVQNGTGLVLWNLAEGNTLPVELASLAPDVEAAREMVACVPREVRGRFGTLKAFASVDGGRVAAFTTQPGGKGNSLAGTCVTTPRSLHQVE